MNKDYPRDCLKMFDVFENGKVVFIGTAKKSKLLCGEWKIRFLDWMIETIYGYRMPGYFCIDNMNFKVSHVKECILIS